MTDQTARSQTDRTDDTQTAPTRTWPGRVILASVLAMITILGLDALVDAYQERQIAQAAEKNLTAILLTSSTQALGSALINQDLQTIRNITNHIGLLPEVLYIAVKDHGGQLIAEAGDSQTEAGSLIVSRRILVTRLDEEQDAGELSMIMRSHELSLTGWVARHTLTTAAVIIVAILAIMLTHHRLSVRLRDLSVALRRLASGHPEQKIPYTDQVDEVGEVARSTQRLYHNTLSLSDLQERLVRNMTLKTREVRDVKLSADTLSRTNMQFMATFSRELRSPLTAIRGAVSLSRHGMAGPVQEKTLHLLGIAENNCLRLEKLVQELMDIYEIQAGTFQVDIREVELISLIQSRIKSFEQLANDKNQRLNLDLPPHVPHVFGDSIRLGQVLEIILSNALEHSGQGADIQVSVEQISDHLRIAVADNGPGIPQKIRPHLFQLLGNTDMQDRGISLALARHIVEAMHGELSYESMTEERIQDSTLSSGTTFFIDLPLSPARVAHEAPSES